MKTKPTFTTIMARAAMTLFLSLLTTATTWATDFITDVMVIGGSKSEVDTLKSTYSKKGWTVIDQDLNAGCGSKSDYVYLLYKTAPDSDESAAFITDFYISTASGTAPAMDQGMSGAVTTALSSRSRARASFSAYSPRQSCSVRRMVRVWLQAIMPAAIEVTIAAVYGVVAALMEAIAFLAPSRSPVCLKISE